MPEKKVTKKNLCFSGEDFKFDTNEESRKFRGVAYSGKMIKDHPWWGNLIFDVESMTFNSRVPVLLNHDMSKIVGSGELSKQEHQLILDGNFSNVTEEGKMAFELVKKEKFPMQESVFILPAEIDELKTGSAKVNGIDVDAPATIFRGGVIKEVSLTPLGADENTSTEAFSFNIKNIENKESKMKKNQFTKFQEILESSGAEEAYKFACSCQKKDGEGEGEGFSEENKILKSENEDLRKELKQKSDELEAMKSKEEANAKQMKMSRIKDVFKKAGFEPDADALEIYYNRDDVKFEANIKSLEKTLSNGKAKNGNEDLTKVTDIGTTDQVSFSSNLDPRYANSVKKDDLEKAEKIRAKAFEFRKADPSLNVAESYEKARISVGE